MTRAGRARPAEANDAKPGDRAMSSVSSAADIDAAIGSLVAARPPLLIVIDFDGTLAIGSRDPAVARIEPLAQRALRRLGGLSSTHPERLHIAATIKATIAATTIELL